VDECNKYVMAIDVQRRGSGDDSTVRPRHAEIDASVGTLSVVVVDVPAEDSLEIAMAEDRDPGQIFGPNRLYPTFSEGIGLRRSDWRLDDSDAFEAEHLVEAGGELGVPVPDEELDRSTAVGEIANQVAGHLGSRTHRSDGQ